MIDDLKIGDFGYFEFILETKKLKEKPALIKGYYKIIDQDKKNIMLQEEELEIIVPKAGILEFKKSIVNNPVNNKT